MKIFSSESLLSAGIIFSLGMILGRLLGFIREVFLSYYLGVSVEADMAMIVLTFPEFVTALLVGGAANMVFIPRFQKISKEKRFSFYVLISLFFLLSFSILTGFLYLGREFLVEILAPKMSVLNQEKASSLMGGALLAIPLIALTAVSRAYLQSCFRFLMTSFEFFLNNIFIICGVIFFIPLWGVSGVVWAMLIGSMARFFSQLITIVRVNKNPSDIKSIGFDRSFFISYLQALGPGLLIVLLPVTVRSFGNYYFGDGMIAVFNYAFKLSELPFATVISVFSVILLPRLSKIVIDSHKNDEWESTIQLCVRSLLFLAIPISLSLIWLFLRLIHDEVSIFNISSERFSQICWLSIAGFIVLPIRGLSSIHLVLMSAIRDTKSLLKINVICFVLTIPVMIFLLDHFGFYGLGAAMGIVYVMVFVMEVFILKKKHKLSILKNVINMEVILYVFLFATIYLISWYVLRETRFSFMVNLIIACSLGLLCLAIAFHKQYLAKFLKR